MSNNGKELSLDEERIQFLEVYKIVPENINRVWVFARNAGMTSILDPSFISQVTLTKGTDTWTEGNEYQAYWVGVSSFKSQCIKIVNDPNEKIIQWRLDLEINLSFEKTIHLYKITDDDTTLLILKMVQLINNSVDTIFMDDEKKFYWNLYNNILNKFVKYLKENENEITHYASCIISQNYQAVFNYLINLNNTAAFGKYFAKKFEYKGKGIKIGTFIKGVNDDNDTIYLRMILIVIY